MGDEAYERRVGEIIAAMRMAETGPGDHTTCPIWYTLRACTILRIPEKCSPRPAPCIWRYTVRWTRDIRCVMDRDDACWMCSALSAQRSVLSAQCSALSAQCSLLTAQCSVFCPAPASGSPVHTHTPVYLPYSYPTPYLLRTQLRRSYCPTHPLSTKEMREGVHNCG